MSIHAPSLGMESNYIQTLCSTNKVCLKYKISHYYILKQDCGVGGKYPTFPKFPTPYHKGNEIWLLKSMEIVVHSKKSVSTKVSKEIVPFQQEIPV